MNAYDWITAEDIIRHALAAYYAECRSRDRDAKDPELQPLDLAIARRQFAQDLADEFSARLNAEGLAKRLPHFHPDPHFARRQAAAQGQGVAP